jgi:hypothetical protein
MSEGTSQCIYFSDKQQLDRLKGLLSARNVSLSGLLTQCIPYLLEAVDKTPEERRKTRVEFDIFI